MSKLKKTLARLTAVCIVLPLVLAAAAGCRPKDNQEEEMTDQPLVIRATEDAIVFEGLLQNRDADVVRVASYETYSEDNPGTVEAVGVTGQYRAQAERYAADGWDKAYDRYYLVKDGRALIGPLHVTRMESRWDYARPKPASKKGLQVQAIDDAQNLGVSHAGLNYSILQIMYPDGQADPNNSIAFTSGGKTYYFRKDVVESYDNDIRSLSDNGMEVTLICLLWGSMVNLGPSQLVHPGYQGAAGGQGRGEIAGYNMTDHDGVAYFAAAMEFTAQRYSRPDQAYGRALNYVIGNEVSTAYIWYNCGELDRETFIDQYTRALRTAYVAVGKYYANANILLSLDHIWNDTAYRFLGIGTEDLTVYKGKDIFDGVSRLSREQGDFPWGVAYHPYPQNLFYPKFWETDIVEDQYGPITSKEFTTRKITFYNLEVLVEYLRQQEHLYQGSMRRIYLTEQGFNTLDPDGMQDQSEQAAAYAYAYYKVKFLDGIEAFILHRHIDCLPESGLNLGLWTRYQDSTVSPRTKKQSYDVFKYIDTERSLEYTEGYLKYIKIDGKVPDSWSELIPGFDESRLADRELPYEPYGETVSSAQTPDLERAVFGGEGLGGWYACDYATSAAAESEREVKINYRAVEFAGGEYASRGIMKKYDTPLDMSAANSFVASVWVPLAETPGAESLFTLRIYSGSHWLSCTVPLRGNAWNYIAVELDGWEYRNAIDRIKIWYHTDTVSNAVYTGWFSVKDMGFKR